MTWDPSCASHTIRHTIVVSLLGSPGRYAPCPKYCPAASPERWVGTLLRCPPHRPGERHYVFLVPALRYPERHSVFNPVKTLSLRSSVTGLLRRAVPPLQTCARSVCSRWYKAVTTAPVEHWFRPGRRLRQTPTGGLPAAPRGCCSRCCSHREHDAVRRRLRGYRVSR